MGQRGFCDEEQRIQMLQDKKPVLVLLSAQIPWGTFLPLFDRGYSQERMNLPRFQGQSVKSLHYTD